MLKTVLVTRTGVETAYYPLQPGTPAALHGNSLDTSRLVSYRTREVNFAEQPAALSLKCSLSGPVNYLLDGRRIVVGEDRLLVINHEHSYSSFVQNERDVSAFSVFFGKPLVEDVVSTRLFSDEQRLHEPQARLSGTDFFENLLPYDQELNSGLQALRLADSQNKPDAASLVERFHQLLGRLVDIQLQLRKQAHALPLAKPATRLEIFRRVGEARDYLHSHFQSPLRLDQVASQVGMAPHHFLRSFKLVTGQTPHQFLIELRLQAAHKLLSARTGATVAAVAELIGFESWEHLSRQFRRRFGVPPGSLKH